MSELLEKVAKCYVDEGYPNNPLNQFLIEDVCSKIREDIVSEEISKITSKSNEIQDKRRLRIKIAEAKEIVFVAVIIGFLVGLLVNQATELISTLKLSQGTSTFTIIIVLLILIFAFYKFYYIDKISKIVEEYYKK